MLGSKVSQGGDDQDVGFAIDDSVSVDELSSDSDGSSAKKSKADGVGTDLPGTADEAKAEENGEKKKKKEPEKKLGAGQLFRFVTGTEKALLSVGALAAFVHGAFWPAFAFVFGRLVNAFAAPPNELYDDIVEAVLYLVYIGIVAQVVGYIQHTCFSVAAERQVTRVRKLYLSSVLKQEPGWFDSNDSGQISSRLVSDTTIMQEAVGERFGQLLQFFSCFVLGFALAFATGWKLTLVQLATTPLLAGAVFVMMTILTSLTTQTQKAYAKAGSVATEVLSAIRTVASFNGEKRELSRYTVEIHGARRTGYKRAAISGFGLGAMMVTMFGSMGLTLWYGLRLVMDGEYDGGQVMTVFFAVLISAFAIGQAGPSMEGIGKGQGAIVSLYETIDRVPVIDSSSDVGKKLPEVTGRIEIRNVTFAYPKRPDVNVLKNFSLEIRPGKTVALVGASGCGKSSTVALLQRFYDPQTGEVLLDGVDIKDMSIRWLRAQFGVVGQEPVLFSGTIADNIRFGRPDATQQEIEEAARMANIHAVIQQFPLKYGTLVGEKGAQLSGGQKQRIAIARMIVKQPKVLLLDEATSALDTESERVVQDALDRVMHGRTTIVIAHRLSTVRNADTIVVLDKGRVAETGTHDELMALDNGLYKALVEAQGLRDRTAKPPGKSEAVRSRSFIGRNIHPDASRSTTALLQKEASGLDATPAELTAVAAESTGKDGKRDGKKSKKDKEYVVPLSRIIRLNKKEIPHLLAGCVGAMVNSAVNPAYALVFGEIVGLFFAPNDRIEREAAQWALIFFGIGVAAMLGNVAQTFFFGIAGERLTCRLRRMAFRSMMRQDVGWFDLEENASANLAPRLATDASLVEGLVGTRLGLTVSNVFTILSAWIVGFIYSWRMTLVMTATLPVIVFSGTVDTMVMVGFATGGRKIRASASRLAAETIGNVRTVASFGAEQRLQQTYNELVDSSSRLVIRSNNISGFLIGAGEMLLFFSYGLGFWYGGVLVRDGIQNLEDIFKVFSAFMMTGMAVGQTAAMASNIAKAKAAASAVFRIIDRRPLIDSESTAGSAPSKVKGEVELKNVVFRYPSRPDAPVLQGLDLSVSPGSVVALVGPSGCGKSSIVSLIERFYDPIEGQVLLDGVDIRDLNLNWLRSQISMVGQEPVLFAGTIRDNIAYGLPEATLEDVIQAAKEANAHKFISSFPDGYDTFVGEKGTQLSGGQKQRVAIARAIIRNPRILLLDEATSALDTESEKVVQKALDGVMKGRTTIVIAHRLSTIRNADEICVIDHGTVIERGSHSDLLALNGVYSMLVSRQETR